MNDVVLAGVGMTTFGRHENRSYNSLVAEALSAAFADAMCPADVPTVVYYANSSAGALSGQHLTRGQHAVRGSRLEGAPLINVENACASGATALHEAWLAVRSGYTDVAVAIGAEKLAHPDKALAFGFLASALDQSRLDAIRAEVPGTAKSVFMDIYAQFASWYMDRTDATVEDFAQVAVKNHVHGARNPKAQYGRPLSLEEVLNAPGVCGPLTVPMCAPMSDGAAAVVVTTRANAALWGSSPVRLASSVLGSGRPGEYGKLVPETARRAFDIADVDVSDVDVVECHDAASPAELIVSEELGLCPPGDGVKLLRSGATSLGGRLPFNPSGGLGSRGHPVAATGLAQVVELADQLRGRCSDRQVDRARVA
jgi:acetyl-CoA acetyltransferase